MDLWAITDLSGFEIRWWQTSPSSLTLASGLSETRHFSWDKDPANTMAYDIHWHTAVALHSFTHTIGSDFRFWGSHVESKMMSLCHGWGWQPPEAASPIHIRHILSVWAHWYTVHGHTWTALHIYSHPTCLRFWDSGSLVELIWCDYVIVEADSDSYLKLLPTSILDIYKEFEHIDMLSIGIHQQPYTVIPTLLLGSDFGVLCLLWSQNDVIISRLRLTAPPQAASHILFTQI